ncbi:MAG: ATP-dependent helicase [Nocardioidaceae bacterium]|nr:ATP-dependent helicase [Nocardioidaceae bacterium]
MRATAHTGRAPAPVLDAHQQVVVDHPGGPLLVLAGPGTGKTTTLVESVVERIERRGLAPSEVLVLTFSRKAAEELRTRIGARLGRTTTGVLASTFHAFCFALVRRFDDPELYADPPTLLSAPEHDVRLRELLQGGRETGRVEWPASVRPALATRGLAAELRGLIGRARSLGLDPADLVDAGLRHDRAEWVAAGQFFAESLEVLDQQHQLDYAELVHRATIVASDPVNRAVLRRELGFVAVDEYQDTDPAQVALLQALAGDGRDLLVVGDPDQSIYAFRGADVRGLLRFPAQFRTRSGQPAPSAALRSTRRFGSTLLAASRSVVRPLPVPGSLDHDTFLRFREPASVAPPYGDGRIEVRTFTSPAAEAEHIALLLRRAHLEEEVAWSQMAVLVRSGVQSIPRLQRALSAAGVPVEVAGDEVPLRAQPAVQTLLRVLRMAESVAAGRSRQADHRPPTSDHRPPLAPADVEALLTSPLAGLGPAAVRRLSRALRDRDRTEHEGRRPPLASAQLLAAAVTDPDMLAGLPRDAHGDAQRAYRIASLVGRAADRLAADVPVEDVLWEVWDGTDWPRRLQRSSEAAGATSRAAHRDLDAVVELFALAARAEQRHRHRGLGAFLDEVDAQQIPADTLAEQGVRGDAVRLLTAHRSKGLEWRVVVVAGVQEGSWPSVRRRGTLLGTDLLGPDGELPALPSVSELLTEERRLFYVAVTRAQQRLVVTAVRGAREAGEQPSRFLADLGVDVGEPEPRPRRPLSLRGLLSELRSRAEDTDDPELRVALARRIARLAGSGAVPAAEPTRWWGVAEPSGTDVPVRPAGEPVALSGSAVDTLEKCPLKWFLSREAGGEQQSTSAQGFGSIVHALAAAVLDGEVPAHADALLSELDRVWGELQFPVSWASAAERAEAGKALDRFIAWHAADRGRTPLGAEVGFEVEVPAGADSAVLRGSMDRVELDGDNRAVVVDLKTGKNAASAADVEQHAQLGVYQVAVRAGALDELAGRPVESGGAELVQLRAALKSGAKVQHQPAPGDDQPLPADAQLARAVVTIRDESFVARTGPICGHCDFRSCCPAQADGRTLLGEPDDAHGTGTGPDAP